VLTQGRSNRELAPGMIHIFINALAASAGGGLTYIRNVLPRLAIRDDVCVTLMISETLRSEITPSARITIAQHASPAG
jgi:hypothetical protein